MLRLGLIPVVKSRPLLQIINKGSLLYKTTTIQKLHLRKIHNNIRHYSSVNQLTNKSNDVIIEPLQILNNPQRLKMSISERASYRLSQIYDHSKEILQIGVESGGCHGYQYNLKLIHDLIDLDPWYKDNKNDFAKKSNKKGSEDDEFKDDGTIVPEDNTLIILPNNKGKIVVDHMSLKILNNTTLIYTSELIGSSFKIINGKLKNKCGCGSSFDLED